MILLLFGIFLTVSGQFGGPNLFGQQIQRQNKTGGGQCQQSVSCMPAPWCRRTIDSNGCPKCTCSMSGFAHALAGNGGFSGMSKSQNKNPALSPMFASGMRGFSSFPSFNGQSSVMNPMAAMFHQMGSSGFNSLTGPTGIGTGALPNTNQPVPTPKKSCDQAPNTCSLPPPWCQRTVNADGCVVCYCGAELKAYLKGVASGQSDKTTVTTISPSAQRSTHYVSTEITTTNVPTAATTTSCLTSFFCTKTCDNGYMTDVSGCPLCDCIKPGSTGVLTTQVQTVQTTTVAPVTKSGIVDGTVICPGIFDCTLMCMSGYQIDGQGCPLCKCLDGS